MKPNSNTSKISVSLSAAKSNKISLVHKNKPSNDVFPSFGENRSNQKNASSNDNQKIMNEFEILKMLDHPNDFKKVPSILYEECPTDLNQVIRNKIFSKVQLVYSIFHIAEGMKYIHSCKIVHSYLKPTNILISDDGTIKISDFKNAQKTSSENEIKKIVDVHSFGEIVYFILSGCEFNSSEKEAVLDSFTSSARKLIESCLYDERERRTTFVMICDILDKNIFKLISLSQQETQDVSKLIDQYRKNIIH